MKVKLRLFALYREQAGKNEVFLELPAEANVATLRQRLEQDFPKFKDHDPMIAVNGVYVPPDHKLSEGDEIALLPPFSGGQCCLKCHSEERSDEESGVGLVSHGSPSDSPDPSSRRLGTLRVKHRSPSGVRAEFEQGDTKEVFLGQSRGGQHGQPD